MPVDLAVAVMFFDYLDPRRVMIVSLDGFAVVHLLASGIRNDVSQSVDNKQH